MSTRSYVEVLTVVCPLLRSILDIASSHQPKSDVLSLYGVQLLGDQLTKFQILAPVWFYWTI